MNLIYQMFTLTNKMLSAVMASCIALLCILGVCGVAAMVAQWLWCSAPKLKVVGSTTSHGSFILMVVECESTFVQTCSVISPRLALSASV